MGKAAEEDLYIDQGETFSAEFQLRDSANAPISLVGASVTGKMRSSYDSPTTVATFTGTVTNADEGKFKILLDATTTAAIAVNPSDGGVDRPKTPYIYDVEVTFADATKSRVLEGVAYVSPEVTY